MTPKPKGRPRFTRQGRAYTPATTMKAEKSVADALRIETMKDGGMWPKEGPLSIEVGFALPVPPSWPKKKQQQARDGDIFHVSRPDIDNMLKLVLDAANGVLWLDDAQLVSTFCTKSYGVEKTGVLIKLFSLSMAPTVTAGDDA